MPSRNRACREAVRAINHPTPSSIWITDDVLAHAFNRYLCASKASKRFGSNVPGPLEAQRRLSKRRMMGLATVGGSPTFDMGAMFGSGPIPRQELRWEPPTRTGQPKASTLPPEMIGMLVWFFEPESLLLNVYRHI
jgi:hypothetical protein